MSLPSDILNIDSEIRVAILRRALAFMETVPNGDRIVDTDGDGKANVKKVLLTGFGTTGTTYPTAGMSIEVKSGISDTLSSLTASSCVTSWPSTENCSSGSEDSIVDRAVTWSSLIQF